MENGAFPKPVVVVSGCLEFEACRYNGQVIPFDLIAELAPFVDYAPICPEVEIGLGTPRDPIRLVDGGDGVEKPRLVQPSTGLDVTDDMLGFSGRFLGSLEAVDGFILKTKSPSCGLHGVKVYDDPDKSSSQGKVPGLFAKEVVETHPELAIEDEGRLRNFKIREHFLTKLFAFARLREVERSGRMAELVRFHSRYKLVLMAYNQTRMRELQLPRYTSVINVLVHGSGYFKSVLSDREKRFFRNRVERYRQGRIPVSGVSTLLHGWAVRFGTDYLLEQAFFEPFPEALLNVADSGKGRLRRS
jgi:uncharacterized protein YbbK (DUF523 family)/uncharacterized protein YbgA (DUF1722 family)